MIPLLHDFNDETVLVFGGGSVGARKARRFAREAAVVVVSPAFAEADFGGAELVRASPDPTEVEEWIDRIDPALVVAATNDAGVNDAIESSASARNLLVNRTDEHGGRDRGSVVVPATVREDPVVVAIATGGTSPVVSRYLREAIEDEIEGAGDMAELTGELRERLQAEGVDPADRRAAVRTVIRSEKVWKALDSGDENVLSIAVDVIDDVTGDRS